MKLSVEKRPDSDSAPQRSHETNAIKHVALSLGIPNLVPNYRFEIGGGWASVDGFYEDASRVFLVEVNARVGPMKTATRNKVIKDAMKLMIIDRINAAAWKTKVVRRILVFSDAESRASFGPRSWANAAFDLVQVETHICHLSSTQRAALEAAQKRQDLRYQPS